MQHVGSYYKIVVSIVVGGDSHASPGDAQICATEGTQNVSNEERGDSSLAVSDLAGSIR